MKYKQSIGLTLTLTALISSVMIIATVALTEPYIKRNKQIKEYEALLALFSVPYTKDTVIEQFNKYCRISPDRQWIACVDQSESLIGRAYNIEGMGFWGKIRAVVAMSPDGERIIGISILEHNETPGLGGRITEPEFLAQFQGKKILPRIIITQQSNPNSDNEVDAITGATETGKALERIINSYQRMLTSAGDTYD